MASRTALAQYILDRLAERRETPQEFARRIGANESGFYKLLRGTYVEPRQSTLDKIAAGFGMTPADLLVVLGKGSASADPDEAEAMALFRQLPTDRRLAAKDMLRGLAVEPVQRRANTRTDRLAKRHQEALRKELGDQRDSGNSPPDGPLVIKYPQVHTLVRFLLSPFQQPLATAPAG